jgi:hypothetical protein
MKVTGLILLALLLTSAGLAQEVWSKYYPGTDFSKYKKYKWVAIESTAQLDPVTDQQLKAAVDAELAKKGFDQDRGSGG